MAEVLCAFEANVNLENLNDETPLHIAAKKKHKEVAGMLLKYDVRLLKKNKKGFTPLHSQPTWLKELYKPIIESEKLAIV